MSRPIAIAAVACAVIGIALALWGYLPARRAADGRSGPDSRWGIRTRHTMKSELAWQHGHKAALIYFKALPWIAGIELALGAAAWVAMGEGAALTVFIVALCCEIFAFLFGTVFAIVAARDVK